MINLLFTSAGRRVELLKTFQQAYKTLGVPGQIVATDIDPLAPALQIAGKPYLVPRFSTEDYIPTLLEICQREKINLIFPLIDPDIPILAEHKQAFEAIGVNPVVLDWNATKLCADKWLTNQFFQEVGIAAPQSWLPQQVDFSQLRYPLFIKPRMGSGSKDAFRIRDEKELGFFIEYVENPIIQEFLSGPEITNDVFCDLDGNILEIVSRQRIETRGGEVTKGVTVKDASITQACSNIAQALNARGPITVQCMLHNGTVYFTEINARFGGGAPLSFAVGANLPLWLLSHVAGIPFEKTGFGNYEVGVHLVRFDDSFFLSEEKCEQMASHRL